MGRCCGASRSERRGEESQRRQRELREMTADLDRVLEPVRREPVRPEPVRGEPVRNPPRQKACDAVTPAWKRERLVHVEDEYGEMVLDASPSELGATYIKGTVPGVVNDRSARNTRLRDFSAEDQEMVAIAQRVLGEVRGSMPRGAFNNFEGLPPEVLERQNKPGTNEHAPNWWNNVVDQAAGLALAQLKDRLPEVNAYKLQMACLARATKEVGGGVCSKMAMVTTGALTTALPPGSEIAQVFCGYDHEFVIARTPGSRWFVVDPWCHAPLVVPAVDCYFEPSSVTNWISVSVVETAPPELPFGIDVETGVDWPAIVLEAQRSVPEEFPLRNPGHEFQQPNNVRDGGFDPALRGVAADEWG